MVRLRRVLGLSVLCVIAATFPAMGQQRGSISGRVLDAAGLVLFDERVRLRMPPRSAPQHLNELLKQLENCEPGAPTRAAGVFHDLAETFKRRCLLIIISDLYDDPEAVLRALPFEASSRSAPSVATACAQSMVSATPGSLKRSRPRSFCMLSGSLLTQAPGAISGRRPRLVWTLTALLMFLLTIGQTILLKPEVIANWQYLVLTLACAALSDPEKAGGAGST